MNEPVRKMSLADVTSARSSPTPDNCPECDTSASVTSDLHKYQVACTCKPGSVQYACADDPGSPTPAKTDTPPALPPRPPTNVLATNRRNNAAVGCSNAEPGSSRRKKYAWWCVGCGALAAALGGLLAAQHILLRAYTASPHHLETVPAAVPAAMLVLTGICIMSLARRRNRYSYMIKVVGACCLVCALTCVLVTITTTVIHMNKLQTLKFCEHSKLTRTCTCFSMPPNSLQNNEEEGVRCVFEGVTDCGVVHGALYWCLRGVFALSVTAVLVCIFSSMLAYQLLSHERKKMYWEQLELRCRSLYRPPAGQNANTSGRPVQNNCNCCSQCHPSQPAWDINLQHRFWAPGRIGNLYSPNPGTVRKTSAWSWFPWPRSNSQNSRSCRMGGVPQSGDSAYGFCETDNPQPNPNPNPNPSLTYEDRTYPSNFQRAQSGYVQNQSGFVQNQSGFVQNQSGFVQNQSGFVQSGMGQEGFGEASGSFDASTGVWGPPPPYSPQGRSGSRHHLHHQDPATATLLHHHHIEHRTSMPIHDHTTIPQSMALQNTHTCNRNSSYITHLMHANPHLPPEVTHELSRINPELVHLTPELMRLNPELMRLNPELMRLNPELARMNTIMYTADVNELSRLQAEMVRMGSDSGRFNTLRGHLVPYPTCQRSLGMSLGNLHRDCRLADEAMTIECVHQKSGSKVSDQSSTDSCQKQGKENLAFQNDKHSLRPKMDHRALNTESEVYFADESSCCNVSVKADCCRLRNVSALVGTIENHPESTSESENGSFTLTRQQRPQPQSIGSKRRPRSNQNSEKKQEKLRQDINNSIRLTEQQIEQLNSSLNSRMSESRMSENSRLNESRISEHSRMNDSRMSEHSRISDSRMSEHSKINDARMNDSRISELSRMNESRISDHSRMNDSRLSELRMSEKRMNEERRISDHSRMDSEGKSSPKVRNHMNMSPLRNITRTSPKTLESLHPRQSSSDSTISGKNQEFFVPPSHSPQTPNTPNTEESLLSDDDRQIEKPECSKLAPDSKYEPGKEILKTNHLRCCSDTNTMDSGWQSGSEKHVTD